MADNKQGLIHRVTQAGIAAFHPDEDANLLKRARVAPTTADEFNTIQPPLLPRACWKLEDMRFMFDSSLVLPEIKEEMPLLREIIEKNTETNADGVTMKPPLSIFGHADPVGDDAYNKTLSGRRAMAIYALITRRTDMWEQLYSHPAGGDNWGQPSTKMMLGSLGFNGPTATRDFQEANDLTTDGSAGPKTREKLFLVYMDSLCGPDFVVAREDFLGGGVDPGGKADYQGCSEFNPLILLSIQENQELSQPQNKSKRNEENAPNRRVMIFLFRPGRRVIPGRWPCPRAKEGDAGCRKRFFVEGEWRRSPGPVRREFKETGDTFACRFYNRFAANSPCEHPLPPPKGKAFLSVIVFFHQEPIADLKVKFTAVSPGGATDAELGQEVKTDSEGVAKLLTPVPIGNYLCEVQYQPPTMITTVPDIEDPFILVLPIGRPYYDFDGDSPFKESPK